MKGVRGILPIAASWGLELVGIVAMLLSGLRMPGLAVGIALLLAGTSIDAFTITTRIARIRKTPYPAGDVVDVLLFEQ